MARQPNELFDKQKIKKYCEDVQITDTQKNAAKEWLDLLDKNKLEKEDQNRSIFENIILQRILGYSVYDYVPEKDNIDYTVANRESGKSLCIEVKGTSTKDLFAYQSRGKKDQENPVKQTWVYMGLGYDYGLCTNYEDFVLMSRSVGLQKIHKLNFRSLKGINNRISEEKLKEFILIFSKKGIFDQDVITKLTNESALAEQEFTDEFYKLYHETRLMLIREFSSLPEVTKYEAIHWAQTYLNRLIFIFFIEDHNFIPVKVFQKRIMDVIKSPSISEYTKLVSENIKDLFKIMNIGSKIHGINGFNGGLFEKEIPTKIYFNDLRDSEFFKNEKQNSKLSKKSQTVDLGIDLSSMYSESLNPIVKNLLIMDSFDFTSDLSVNILGHIFEQSISDLEKIRGQSDSTRKHQGIFYTPEYITDYICRNTVIPYLSESGVNTVSELIDEYSNNLTNLEKKIKEIKIADPSCGSGAFLIKTVDILLEIEEEMEKIKSYAAWGPTQLKNWSQEREIEKVIEANIYGVDLNEESVEITQLSLFLKLAAPNRKLISLSKNIKIGNSLIEDKSIDSKTFNWNHQFPEVTHENYGGFDVIMGNPPYVFGGNVGITNKEKAYFKEKFVSGSGKVNLFALFIEKGINLLKTKGILSFIVPNTLLRVTSYENIRKYILDKTKILQIVNLESGIFKDATTSSIIIILQKEDNKEEIENHQVKIFDGIQKSYKLKHQSEFHDELHIFDLGATGTHNSLKNKISLGCVSLGSICKEMIFGVVITKNQDEVISNKPINDMYKKFLEGRDIDRYKIKFDNKFLLYDKPKLHRARTREIFEAKEKILVQRISGGKKPLKAAYDNEQYYDKESINNIILADGNFNPKYILALLNSHLMNWYYSTEFTNASDLTVNVSKAYLSQLPIRNITLSEQKPSIELVDEMISLNKQLNEIKDKKTNEKEPIEKEIKRIDSEIDDLIYKLYGLTDPEIESIEASLK